MNAKREKEKLTTRILNSIERHGNKLPDPFFLFFYLAIGVIILSWFISLFDVSFTQPGDEEVLVIKSLISKEGFEFIVTSMLDNFITFKPLGIVLAMMLGIGLADKVGLLETAIKSTIIKAPNSLVTYAVVVTGILGNLASDAAFVIIPPLAAMVFYNINRHPLAGLAAGFAGVGAGFTANVMITGADAVLSGISTEVTESMGTDIVVTPVDNWYFMIASVVVLTVVAGLVTEKIVEPRLGTYQGAKGKEYEEVTQNEFKALIKATIAGLIYIALIVIAIFAPNSPLTNDKGGLVPSLFLGNIIPFILFFFLVIAITYGIATKKITDSKSIANFMSEGIKDMSGFIVLIFTASQFIAYFDWTNIGTWIAVIGAGGLESIGITGVTAIIGFVLLTAILNLFIFSGSAQWALQAPIFIKMFYYLGFSPAFVQVAYRIADSSTNIITPMNPYILIVLAYMKDYDKKAGIGSLIALMLPYSIFFLSTWIILLLIFVFLGIPFGPGIEVYL